MGVGLLAIVVICQAVSVVGDTLGQRASRRYFKGNTRRMLMVLSVVSCVQVAAILGLFQLLAPAAVSGAIYSDSGTLPCYQEVDYDGRLPSYCDQRNCTATPCPSQGPGSMFRSVRHHPLLLLNGLQSLVYYVGEVLMYQQPMGLVLLVMASLVSSFVIVPFEALFGIQESSLPPTVVLLGIVGAAACVLELPLSPAQRALPTAALYRALLRALCPCLRCGGAETEPTRDGTASLLDVTHDADDADDGFSGPLFPGYDGRDDAAKEDPAATGARVPEAGCRGVCKRVVAIAVPFFALAAVYSTWFVTQKVFNDEYRMNMYGYTSWDQILNPFYVLPVLLVLDLIGPCRNALLSPGERATSFADDARLAWKEATDDRCAGLILVFTYRLLINARAVGYFYVSVAYNLQRAYFELQVTRVLMSWAMAVALCFAPAVIGLTPLEIATTLSPANMALKVGGSVLIVAALILVVQ